MEKLAGKQFKVLVSKRVVEAAARADYERIQALPGPYPEVSVPWDDLSEEVRERFEPRARVMIEAALKELLSQQIGT